MCSFFMNLFPGTKPFSGPLPPSQIGLPGATLGLAAFFPAGREFAGEILSSFLMSNGKKGQKFKIVKSRIIFVS